MADTVIEQTNPPITLEQLMALENVEIINGEMVQMAAAGIEHHLIGANIYDVLKPFAQPT